jgi:hypothetical protein
MRQVLGQGQKAKAGQRTPAEEALSGKAQVYGHAKAHARTGMRRLGSRRSSNLHPRALEQQAQ